MLQNVTFTTTITSPDGAVLSPIVVQAVYQLPQTPGATPVPPVIRVGASPVRVMVCH